MASQVINHIADADGDKKETAAITVGSGEKVAVRLSRFDVNCRCALKVSGNGVVSFEDIDSDARNVVFDSVPENHEVSVVTRRPAGGGGIEGVLETYS